MAATTDLGERVPERERTSTWESERVTERQYVFVCFGYGSGEDRTRGGSMVGR